MLTAPIFVRDLTPGEHIQYGDHTYVVCEVLTAPGLDGSTVVIGRRSDDCHRYALVYANTAADVELVTHG